MAERDSVAHDLGTVMLVDGNSLAYRAFFALPEDMTTASGQVTNAVYGFTMMLMTLLRDHRPDRLAVAFDRPEPTFRHERITSYKANRRETPDTLRQQLGLVRQLVSTLQITAVDHAGVEADDVIATLATQARDRGDNVIIVTGDRDAYQLVEDPHIRVLYNKRGVSDYALYDEAGIEERTGVKPADYVAYAALRGDPSDNLPGVDGVGEKTAAKLINAYGGIEELYQHLDDQTPKLQQNLGAAEERVKLNLELMELLRDVPLDVGVDDLGFGQPDAAEVKELFEFLEFRRFGEFVADVLDVELDGMEDGAGALAVTVDEVSTAEAAAEALTVLAASAHPVALSAAWGNPLDPRQPHRRQLLGLAFSADLEAGKAVWLPADLLESSGRSALAEYFGGGNRFSAHDAKPLIVWLLGQGIDAAGLVLDTRIAAYLLDPASGRYELGDLLRTHSMLEFPDADQPDEARLFGEGSGDPADPSMQAGLQALAVSHLAAPLLKALDAQGLRHLNDVMEVPLVRVLARMEHVGIRVDVDALTRLRDQLASDAERLRASVIEAAGGGKFNVNSSKQISELLFDKLGLTPQKKTPGGAYSTDAATLEKLRGEHPVVDELLDYREVEKLRSTYGEGLVAAVGIEPDNRIRATFNQTVARTGRLSSDAPNLHNIPVRTETGRVFREVFVADVGCEFLVADYNQIELRCIAHLAEDPGLIDAFESGQDIHTSVAAQVFGIDPGAVGIEERSTAKMVSYGLAYGMEAYGLGQRLNIPTGEAAIILDAYFAAFPALREYMEKTVAEARARGYTETLFGRRRRIPEISSSNFRLRQAAERQAMNAGIQGLAADIFKVALVRLDHALENRGFDSRIILQVHDEVILEVPEGEQDAAAELTVETMAGACQLRVPLEVHLSSGRTWADAK
ncbi:DNA polymerase I [Candidatus Poriferisocius sp.]|uniref:DNA polymerase I n=1 Tax=Candidatus Poriferisocius sp. TaxID=3101276 RepID=UPI003B52F83B